MIFLIDPKGEHIFFGLLGFWLFGSWSDLFGRDRWIPAVICLVFGAYGFLFICLILYIAMFIITSRQ